MNLYVFGEGHWPPSEFENLVNVLKPLLQDTPQYKLTAKNVGFLANESGLNPQYITYLAESARRQIEADSIHQTTYYGLFRQNFPTALTELLDHDIPLLRDALEKSARENIIPWLTGDHLDEITDQLWQLKADLLLESAGPGQTSSLGDLLGTLELSSTERRIVAELYVKHDKRLSEEFWTTLGKRAEFTAEKISQVRFTLQLGDLTGNHLPLILELKSTTPTDPSDKLLPFAKLNKEEWKKKLKLPIGVPPTTPGADLPAKMDNYATSLAQYFEKLLPTVAIAAQLKNDKKKGPFKETYKDLNTFFDNNPEFEFRIGPIDLYLSEGREKLQGVNDKGALIGQLKKIQRLYNISPVFQDIRTLLADDLHSAQAIAYSDRRIFLERYAKLLGGLSKAQEVHRRAEHVHAMAINLNLKYSPAFNSPMPYVIYGDGKRKAPTTRVPDLATLFGSLNFCDCQHCMSLYSPAAYLVDILKFLNGGPKKNGQSPLQVLLNRRPDLEHIELSCENTNTRLPYVDLVQEILENSIAPFVPKAVPIPAGRNPVADLNDHKLPVELNNTITGMAMVSTGQEAKFITIKAGYEWVIDYLGCLWTIRCSYFPYTFKLTENDKTWGVSYPKQIIRVILELLNKQQVPDQLDKDSLFRTVHHPNAPAAPTFSITVVQVDWEWQLTRSYQWMITRDNETYNFDGNVAHNFNVNDANELDQGSLPEDIRTFLDGVNSKAIVETSINGLKWLVTLQDQIDIKYKAYKLNIISRYFQTSGTPDELNANPEHTNTKAYDQLRQAVYPWNLPLNLPLEEVRVYLGHLGVPRRELMETFFPGTRSEALSNEAIAYEYLGLTEEETNIITGNTPTDKTPTNPWEFWGLKEKTNDIEDPTDGTAKHATGDWDVVLQRVSIFLQQSGLSYKELLELLLTNFINQPAEDDDRILGIVSISDVVTTCNPSQLEIQVIDSKIADKKSELIAAWKKIHRFVRLWRKLGWTMRDLDKAITALNHHDLDDAFLLKLSHIQRLRSRLNLPPVNILSFWSTIDTARSIDYQAIGQPEVKSLYEQLFLNKASVNPVDSAFELNETRDELNNPSTDEHPITITAHTSTVTAALGITDAELALLQNLEPSIPRQEITSKIIGSGVECAPDKKPVFVLDLGEVSEADNRFTIKLQESEDGLRYSDIPDRYLKDHKQPDVINQDNDDRVIRSYYEGTKKFLRVAVTKVEGTSPKLPMSAHIESSRDELQLANLLDLANLSSLFRISALAKALKLSIRDWLAVRKLITEIDPFRKTEDTLKFVDKVGVIRSSGFSINELNYLLRHDFTLSSGVAPTENAIASTLSQIRSELQKIASDNKFVEDPKDPNGLTSDPNGDLTRKKLVLLNMDAVIIEQVVATLNDAVTYEAELKNLPDGVDTLPNATDFYEVPLAALPEKFVFPAGLDGLVKLETPFLFSIEAQFAEDLDKKENSNPLRDEFDRHGVTIPESASVTVHTLGSHWEIADGDKKLYSIRKAETTLAVYDEVNKKLRAARALTPSERDRLSSAASDLAAKHLEEKDLFDKLIDAIKDLIQLQDELRGAISFDKAAKRLRFKGAMTHIWLERLQNASPKRDEEYLHALNQLYEAPRQFVARQMRGFSIIDHVADLPALPKTVQIPEALKNRVYFDDAAKKLHFVGVMTVQEHKKLLDLSNDLNDASHTAYLAAVENLFQDFATDLPALPVKVQFPEELKNKVYFDSAAKKLHFIGIMTSQERDKLLALSSDSIDANHTAYVAAVGNFYQDFVTDLPALPVKVQFPEELKNKVYFDSATKRLHFIGVMTAQERDKLLALSSDSIDANHDAYLAAIEILYQDLAMDFATNLPALPVKVQFPEELKNKVYFDSAAKKLHFIDVMTAQERDKLLALSTDPKDSNHKSYLIAVEILFRQTQAGDVFLTPDDIIKIFADASTSVERFLLVLKKLLPYLRLTLSELVIKQWLGDSLKLDANIIGPLLKNWVNSKLEPTTKKAIADFLHPEFAESSPNITPSQNAFPHQFNTFWRLHKIALVITKFKLTPRQLQWLFEFGPENKWLDLNALPIESISTTTQPDYQGWERLTDLFRLRDALSLGETLLTDVFMTARNPDTQLDTLLDKINKGTQWEIGSLKVLNGTSGFNFSVEKYQDEAALVRLSAAFVILQKIGASAEQCLALVKPTLTLEDARNAKSLVRAKYDSAQWLEKAKALHDPLREKKRYALVSYSVANLPHLTDVGGTVGRFRDAKELYEHFLIDVEMSPCMMTTRIKQAISSVQLFIQRCLMNLEDDVSLSHEEAQEWAKWRKYYRVWEANRKVLLYPENWIEPELRDDKSPFFKDLENELLQSDVNSETAEDAFLHYLERLDQVARLDIVGVYHQHEEKVETKFLQNEEETDILHVFGRTYSSPHIYFYRRLKNDNVWSAWEKLDLDIEGSHLIPIVWNRRLYLFWAIFNEKQVQPSKEEREKNKDSSKYWEIKLAWSEYKNQKWSPKKISKKSLENDVKHLKMEPEDFSFKTRISQGYFGPQLSIECYGTVIEILAEPPKNSDGPQTITKPKEPLIKFPLMTIRVPDPVLEDPLRTKTIPFLYLGKINFKQNGNPITSKTDRDKIKVYTNMHSSGDPINGPSDPIILDKDGVATTSTIAFDLDCFLVSDGFSIKEVGNIKSGFDFSKGAPTIDVDVDLSAWPPPKTEPPASDPEPPTRISDWLGFGEFTLDDCNGEIDAERILSQSMIPEQLMLIQDFKIKGMEKIGRNGGYSMLKKTPDTFCLLDLHQSYVPRNFSPPLFYQDALHTYFVTGVPTGLNLESHKSDYQYKYRFSTFYHPYVCAFIKMLNRFGITGLLTLDNQRPTLGTHFYTTDEEERVNAIATLGYQNQGIACYILNSQDNGSMPLYRLFNQITGAHLYTTDIAEYDEARANKHYFIDKGCIGYVYDMQVNGTQPLYRLQHPEIGDNFYTTSSSERDIAIFTCRYQSVKIACYVFDAFSGEPLRAPLYRLINTQKIFKKYYPSDLVVTPYPGEDVDFDDHGAYSLYNWELFFHTPFLIALQLSKNQRFEEAQRWFHFIFDPTSTDSPEKPDNPGPERFWRVKPFFDMAKQPIQTLEDLITQDAKDFEEQVKKWEADPFKPHVIARLRHVAYMKAVVMRYIDNLIAWGDQLFRRETIESSNEATQLYILAAQILGRRPDSIPARAKPKMQTFRTLDDIKDLNSLSNTAVEIENFMPPSSAPILSQGPQGVLTMPFFCTPGNDKLQGYWDTVSDRLFKIRHCMNIEGVVRTLPIYEPPIDPALLVRAAAAGIDLNSVLSDLNAPLSHYRFGVMLQKATKLCNDVKALGAALLSALEKRDAEILGLLRSSHEIDLLKAMREIKKQQIEEANNTLAGLKKYEDVVTARQQYYQSREYMNPFEIGHIALATSSLIPMSAQLGAEVVAAILHLIPNTKAGGPTTAGVTYGGDNIASAVQAFGSAAGTTASMLNTAASLSATLGGYQRRQEDWTHQADLASKELQQVGKQIAAAEIRVAIAEKELENHDLQIENAKAVDDYMCHQKFTSQELYSWMIGKISGIYFQGYQLAYDVAKRAERSYRYELGLKDSNFIQFGYWDSLKKGLLSGEQLHHDLKRLDVSYLDQNKRELEVTKHISLAQLDPYELMLFKQSGKCIVNLPEALFDLDYPGHYLRRIKSVSLSIPCVTGPYTSVNCTLTQLKSSMRHNTILIKDGKTYARDMENDDSRFVDSFGAIQSIATSHARDDSGMFELNFRDERYLHFEGTGVISTWQLEMPMLYKQFDYTTISDVVLHFKYTARDGGGILKCAVEAELKDRLNELVSKANANGLFIAFSLKQEFPSEWYQFIQEKKVALKISTDRLPFFVQGSTPEIVDVTLLASTDLSENGIKVITTELAWNQMGNNLYEGRPKENNDPKTLGITFDKEFELSASDVADMRELVFLVKYSMIDARGK